jgi:phosphoribosylaminoimidazole-succinocarboxamide synthase
MMIAREQIVSQLNNCLLEAKYERWQKYYRRGKVRDMYLLSDKRILITTDRQSAFDYVLGAIPLKGQVLNRIALHWFEKTRDIVPNQVIAVPDPNVTVAKELHMLPVEVVVRRYLTGSSDTAIWTYYSRGTRQYCGHTLPEGMVKNQPLHAAIITPTTKSDVHDELISAHDIVARGLVAKDIWQRVEEIALALFARGAELAAQRGLILVDTKYEMGLDEEGRITVADEIHTPDSSRYWIKETYEERFARGQEPESLDKEFLRLWLRDKGISDKHIPALDDEIRVQVAQRYVDLYERVTGESFVAELGDEPVTARIERNIQSYFAA